MVVRKYNIPDADMMEDSRTNKTIFESDKALFVALNPEFDDPFAADWLSSIEASEATETAETRDDRQRQATAEVEQAMASARAKYNEVKYFVEEAFPGNKDLQARFGLNDYDEAANDQAKMVLFLNNLHKWCVDPVLSPPLTAKGLSAPRVAEILTIRDLLLSENNEQEVMIVESPVVTEQRVNTYNTTYAFRQKVNRASKVVFAGNTAKLNEYKLPGGSSDENFNVEGRVTDAAAPTRGLYKVTVQLVELNITDKTTTLGNYGFVAVPPGTYTLRFTLAGYTTVERPITVLQSGKVVENVSMAVV